MHRKSIYLGNTRINDERGSVEAGFVEIENEKFYKISNFNLMSDFFMTIVSDSDHWMFISSNGSLSAGRKDRNNALFPYYTVDKIHDYRDITGSKTIMLVTKDEKTYLWEPFTSVSEKIYRVERNIYKNIYCNKIIFEEINLDLGVLFQYGWYNSEKFGFIKKSVLHNKNNSNIHIDILDGIKNILPSGVDYDFQNAYSCLLDAYKKCELTSDSKLGLYSLSSIPVDKAEPSESLKASTVWLCNLDSDAKILLSDHQLENFKNGLPIEEETDIRAVRGAYFVNASIELTSDEQTSWMIVADINQDSSAVANLDREIKNSGNIGMLVNADIDYGTSRLKKIVSNADGLQIGNEELSYARHFSNTLFNVMRGGVFHNNYTIDTADFRQFAEQLNKGICNTFKTWLDELPPEIEYADLIALAENTKNKDLVRICYEYLPLSFSRRHGDPSRPWNQFSIETKNDDGSVKLNYQGNWRDIFQNWEALSLSFPGFLESMISKFVNASTADGYNPYRITRDGIDWESPDPDDSWAYIGYWGDHQIIYLQKLLEMSGEFNPGILESLLDKDLFVYANVPYRIKPYTEILKNPKDTITFDFGLNDNIRHLVEKTGADGRLLTGRDNDIYRVNLTEKILVSILTKLCNFIPEAGIWLNTQRPEWNDANNALVGNGASMVTLCYLRRSLQFWAERFIKSDQQEISISEEVANLYRDVYLVFKDNTRLLKTGFSDSDRRTFADALGEASSEYRKTIYSNSFSCTKRMVQMKSLAEFAELGRQYLDQSIRVNKRSDGLYHSYNLISFSEQGISIRPLYEMLEGQVAVLSAGYLSVHESLEVLNSLKRSSLFRHDQYSYLLYPDRQLPRFIEKNNIPPGKVNESLLLSKLVASSNSSIISKDDSGNFHFNGSFRNAAVLEKALLDLDPDAYSALVVSDKDRILALYEEVFDHHSFTGRSGTFFAYEGLGSIYWHMVSKLLLAVQECYFRGVKEEADETALGKIKEHYYEIQAGLGLYKSPELYGAFPTDAYSHTPAMAGAQQPGMTGQVKEDIITRMRELGIHIEDGNLVIKTHLLNMKEVLDHDCVFEYFNIQGEKHEISLKTGQMGFTFCQVPFVYTVSDEVRTIITFTDGKEVSCQGNKVEKDLAASIFKRTGEIYCVEILINVNNYQTPKS
ncbi:MAG: hypothetical protein AB9842_07375 [Bacteroidales bacterium]